jgi:hypothetical protein
MTVDQTVRIIQDQLLNREASLAVRSVFGTRCAYSSLRNCAISALESLRLPSVSNSMNFLW